MNTKKLFLAVIVVYVLLQVLNYLIHGVLLASTYQMENIQAAFRPESDMSNKMWIMFLSDAVWSFFFVFFFAKGYEGKGIMEGLRFGFYIGLFWSMVSAFSTYVVAPIPYTLALQWFAYGMIVSLILGAVTSMIYKPAQAEAASA